MNCYASWCIVNFIGRNSCLRFVKSDNKKYLAGNSPQTPTFFNRSTLLLPPLYKTMQMIIGIIQEANPPPPPLDYSGPAHERVKTSVFTLTQLFQSRFNISCKRSHMDHINSILVPRDALLMLILHVTNPIISIVRLLQPLLYPLFPSPRHAFPYL